jgi:precorrin-2 dehydrogenase/sirohydrochlorin ferrochelatase
VTVISPALTPRLQALAAARSIRHEPRSYQPGDLAGFDLGFAATDDGAVNSALAGEGRRRGAWVNAADDADHSDFILPSIIRRGPLTVAVGTEGTSPALARAVREELERHLGPEYAELAALVGDVRRDLRARHRAPSAEVWRRALDAELRALVAAGRRDQARQRLLDRLGAA